jgi:hypothetical protein
MALNLTYCQLIKIILAQIGGSPLQQIYTQLSQNLQQITKGSLLNSEIAQLAAYIQQVTTALNNISGEVNAMEALANQFLYNPVGTVTSDAISALNSRIAQITTDDGNGNLTPISGKEAEYAKLLETKTGLTQFLAHTNKLVGVTPNSSPGNFGGCTLADLLGNGCAANPDVPNIDLQIIADGFKSGALITQVKNNVLAMVANTLGYTQALASINNLLTSVNSFNNVINNKLNKIVIQRAVETYITNLAFQLLSGCSTAAIQATIKPEALTAMTPLINKFNAINAGELNADGTTPGSTSAQGTRTTPIPSINFP